MNKIFALLLFVVACNAPEKKQPEEQHNQDVPVPQSITSLDPFADSLVRLDKYNPAEIEKAAYYYKKLMPADTLLADSASAMFWQFTMTAVDSVNQKLFRDTVDYFNLIYKGDIPPTESQLAFQQRLKEVHILLQGDGEGGVYAVLDYDWFTSLITPKTSTAVDTYFQLTGAEEKDPALLDAALAIELEELIRRLLVTETLVTQKLPVAFSEETIRRRNFYTGILLFGSDNTPALQDETSMELTPEFKKGYDYLLATYPGSKAAGQVKEWLQVLKSKNRQKKEQMQQALYQ